MPLVSVIMPVYNRELYLGEAIESILSQTFTDFELIIVDDGSTDRSPDIIRDYQSRDDRLRFILLQQNGGQAAARNRGIDEANSRFIAFMDSDDVSLPDRLRRQVSFLQQNPDIGAVGTYAQATSHDLSPTFVRRLPCDHALIVYNFFTFNPALFLGTLLIRQEPLRELSGFDPTLRFGEEGDFYARLFLNTSIRVANLPDILYLVRQHDTNNSSSKSYHHQQMSNAHRLISSLWPDASSETVARFRRLRHWEKLTWSERRAAKRDYMGIIDAMINRRLALPGDRPLLIAEMNRRLERASPRLWQKLCHWYRYRVQRPS